MRLRPSSSLPAIVLLAAGAVAMLMTPVAAAQVRVDARARQGNAVKKIQGLRVGGSIDSIDSE